MPCKLNHNLICLGLGSLSIGFETNLKLLTNRNVQFHWTLLLEPLSKVPLRYQYIKLQDQEKYLCKKDLVMSTFIRKTKYYSRLIK
jgi:hypothetical protein